MVLSWANKHFDFQRLAGLWLAKWLIMLGFMDFIWPRVCRHFTVDLVSCCCFCTTTLCWYLCSCKSIIITRKHFLMNYCKQMNWIKKTVDVEFPYKYSPVSDMIKQLTTLFLACLHPIRTVFSTSLTNVPSFLFLMNPTYVSFCTLLKSSPLGQNGRLFKEDIFRCIFVNEKFCILIKISLKLVPKGQIDNNTALV